MGIPIQKSNLEIESSRSKKNREHRLYGMYESNILHIVLYFIFWFSEHGKTGKKRPRQSRAICTCSPLSDMERHGCHFLWHFTYRGPKLVSAVVFSLHLLRKLNIWTFLKWRYSTVPGCTVGTQPRLRHTDILRVCTWVLLCRFVKLKSVPHRTVLIKLSSQQSVTTPLVIWFFCWSRSDYPVGLPHWDQDDSSTQHWSRARRPSLLLPHVVATPSFATTIKRNAADAPRYSILGRILW